MNRLAHAADRVARLEPELRRARADVRQAILDAYVLGVEPTTIARTAGLSRQRISQILRAAGHDASSD